MKKMTMIALLMVLAFALTAEEIVLSVDQSVERALENNIGLQMNAIELVTKKRAKDTVWNSFLPSMNASVGYSYADRLFGAESSSTSVLYFDGAGMSAMEVPFDIESTQTATLGFQASLPINMALGKGIRQTILDYEAGKLDYEKATRELEVSIRKQFWLIKALEAGVVLEQQNLETLEKRYQQTQINYQNGLVPELAVLSAQVSMENKRPSVSQKQADLENTMAFFKFLLGYEQTDSIRLDGEMVQAIEEYDSEQLIAQHLNDRLDIQQINHQIISLENTKAMTTLYNLTPTISLGMNWGTQISDPFDSDSWDGLLDNYSLSANLIIPLDGFIPNSGKSVQIKEIQDGIDTLELARKQVYENAVIEITNLVRKLENSNKTLKAYAYNVELAEKSYRLNSEAYNLGTVELLDVEDAQDKLFQAEYAVLFETYNYLSAQLDLRLALNKEIR